MDYEVIDRHGAGDFKQRWQLRWRRIQRWLWKRAWFVWVMRRVFRFQPLLDADGRALLVGEDGKIEPPEDFEPLESVTTADGQEHTSVRVKMTPAMYRAFLKADPEERNRMATMLLEQRQQKHKATHEREAESKERRTKRKAERKRRKKNR